MVSLWGNTTLLAAGVAAAGVAAAPANVVVERLSGDVTWLESCVALARIGMLRGSCMCCAIVVVLENMSSLDVTAGSACSVYKGHSLLVFNSK
jgi:hypothetical protein